MTQDCCEDVSEISTIFVCSVCGYGATKSAIEGDKCPICGRHIISKGE